MSSHPDAVLRGGVPDRAAVGADLSVLFSRHGAAVLGICRVLLRDRHEAEDAAQQTFLSAYRSMLGGAVPRHPAGWLATIARNECLARIQRRMREPLPTPGDEDALPEQVVDAAESADLGELWRAIAALPRKQRQAILLREFSGLSYSELALALEVSEPAVESLLVRARSTLRQRLQLAYQSAAGVAPLVAIRMALARATDGMPDPDVTRGLAKLATAPALAKVLAGAAAVVAAGGTVAAVENGAGPPSRGAQVAASAPPSSRAAPVRIEPRAPAQPQTLLPARSAPAPTAVHEAAPQQVLTPAPSTRAAVRLSAPAPSRLAPAAVVPAPPAPADQAPADPTAAAPPDPTDPAPSAPSGPPGPAPGDPSLPTPAPAAASTPDPQSGSGVAAQGTPEDMQSAADVGGGTSEDKTSSEHDGKDRSGDRGSGSDSG